MSPRWPLPIGVNKSITRMDIEPVGVSNFKASSGWMTGSSSNGTVWPYASGLFSPMDWMPVTPGRPLPLLATSHRDGQRLAAAQSVTTDQVAPDLRVGRHDGVVAFLLAQIAGPLLVEFQGARNGIGGLIRHLEVTPFAFDICRADNSPRTPSRCVEWQDYEERAERGAGPRSPPSTLARRPKRRRPIKYSRFPPVRDPGAQGHR